MGFLLVLVVFWYEPHGVGLVVPHPLVLASMLLSKRQDHQGTKAGKKIACIMTERRLGVVQRRFFVSLWFFTFVYIPAPKISLDEFMKF